MGRPLSRLTYGTINTLALRKLDYRIGVSDAMVDLLIERKFDPEKLFAIYNGLDFTPRTPAMRREEYLRSVGLEADADCVIAGIAAPKSVALVGFLMFGNLLRECLVLDSLSETAQKVLANLITLFLGITVGVRMQAEYFLQPETLMILALGLVAFMFDTFGGVLFAKLLNLFLKEKINPMIGAAGISAFPMASRVVHKLGREADDGNWLLMHAAGANVAGQIASVIAGGLIIALVH